MLPNPYILLAAVVGAMALAAVSFGLGHHYAKLQEAEAIAKAEAAAIARTQVADQITHDADVAAAQAQQKIVHDTQTIIQKVPVYVTKKADAACDLTRGTVRLLNASAANVQPVPAVAGQSDDASAGVALDTAVAVIVQNYGTYAEVVARLEALQNWVRAQQANAR